jgi:hypothetical protein
LAFKRKKNTAEKCINVTLKSDSAELQEVVVVGYGVKKEKLLVQFLALVQNKLKVAPMQE